jgi:hypothetical protein
MLRTISLLVALSYASSGANDPIREVESQATRGAHQLVPAFYQGYFYWVGRDGNQNSISIYAPDGHLAFALVSPNGPVNGVAIDDDGTVAVAWGRWGSRKGGGLDFRDRSGALMKTIETGRFLPRHLAFAEDHSLWSFGCQLDAVDPEQPDLQDHMTVRKYLPNGREAGAYLPRSVFPAGLEPGEASWQTSSSITVARDRIGLSAYSGQDSDASEWVEMDLSGNLLGRWRLDQFRTNTRIAFTKDNSLFVQSRDSKGLAHLYMLDRASSTWRIVETSPKGRLEGAHGDSLVFSDPGFGPMHVRWYSLPH